MIKQAICVLTVVFLLGGCVSRQGLSEQIAKAIRENPQIVLQAMRENSIDVLEIVEKGVNEREKARRKEKFESAIKNPYTPDIKDRVFLGKPEATVTVVEYSDFLCPYCSKGAKVVRKLVAEHPEKYKLVFKHLPLHKNSRELAAVFEAVAMIDTELAYKFHDMAFEKQKELYQDKDGKVLGQIISELKIDPQKLQQNLESPVITQRLVKDGREAEKFGLDATPTFLINGVPVLGYLPADRFDATVDMILEKSSGADQDDGEVCEDCLNKI
ncbi:thioredoxin domain-containing protein [Maridesulfovibrio sp.]|uniref:DsbA family protein n=1 Tax=Maridesulfovibrio sp. TaxID=2795000 RepID=UPI002A187C2B|nr:thioredoxin domain-containing protein [Maridesulfovibrio sp.]